MANTVTTWYPTASSVTATRLTLFCFPHGGGDVSSFRDWHSGIGDQIDVVPVSLPGRERRIAEPLMPSITGLADALVHPTLGCAAGAFALFGHSMGALIAFELAHRLTAAGRPPALLVVSGSAAPQTLSHSSNLLELSDDDFLACVSDLGGVPAELLDVPEMRALLLPILRADYLAYETYRFTARPILDVPVLVLGGDRDSAVAPVELESWREVTSGPVTIRLLSGGHFFIRERLEDVLAAIHADIDAANALDQKSTSKP